MIEQPIRDIQSSGYQGVIAATGGGAGGINELLQYGGSSSTILEAVVPYATQAFHEFVKGTPEKFCSAEGARLLALASYQRALHLSTTKKSLFGVGVTCSLMRHENERAGREHWVYAAFQSDDKASVLGFKLQVTTRLQQEELASKILVASVLDSVGSASCDLMKNILASSELVFKENVLDTRYFSLISGKVKHLRYGKDSQVKLLIPGSFNPLHQGHLTMAEVAAEHTQETPVFDISLTNVDKLPLDMLEAYKRREQFRDKYDVVLTNAPKFIEKARLFPGCIFAVGVDTWMRVIDEKYYSSFDAMCDVFDELEQRGCRFLVFGRKVDGEFLTATGHLAGRFAISIPENKFRVDISSTEIRNSIAESIVAINHDLRAKDE